MREYKSSGIAPLSGILTALAFGLIAAVVMGGILFAIDHFVHFYLILIFPAAAGFAVGFALSAGVTAGKIRNGAVAMLIGVICGIATMGTYHFLSYQIGFKSDVKNAISQNGAAVTDRDEQAAEDVFLTDEVKQTGFPGYLSYEAKQGITITRASSSSGFSLKGPWAWGYFGLEVAFVMFIAGGLALSAANEPFDERSNAWYGKAVHVLSAPLEQSEAIQAALKRGAFTEAGQLMTRTPLGPPKVDLTARSTPDGHPDNIVLELSRVTLDNKKNPSTARIEHGMVNQAELQQIIESSSENTGIAGLNEPLAPAQ